MNLLRIGVLLSSFATCTSKERTLLQQRAAEHDHGTQLTLDQELNTTRSNTYVRSDIAGGRNLRRDSTVMLEMSAGVDTYPYIRLSIGIVVLVLVIVIVFSL